MKRTTLAVLFWVGLGILTAGAGARASTAITEPEAHAIGVDAYLYFYSLVTMDLTREQLSNVEPGKGFGGPMNTLQTFRRILRLRIERWYGPTSTRSIPLRGLI